jgi:hypothetical protein
MSKNQFAPVVIIALLLTAPAKAGGLDVLSGKFAFDWLHDPDKAKCVKVTEQLLNEFKSKRYRCDLTVKKNTSTEVGVRLCTSVPNDKEYLIFETKRQCDDERETQASNE